MLIKEVSREDIPKWLILAAEVEPIFQGSMVNNKDFHDYMNGKIDKREAFMALDRENGNELMGIIGFSRTYNRVTWLGVFEKYRNKGVGTRLLSCALNQLDRMREITLSTYRGGYEPGDPARHVYHKLGFTDFDNTIFDDQGNPRCLMKLMPDSSIRQGQSFHHKYRRFMEWSDTHNCPVCRNEEGPPDIVLIKEMEHSWLEASMEAQGCLWGKCHLLCKNHYTELFEMSKDDLMNFMTDLQKASKALKAVSGAVKINYEIHGNSMPHLHVHLFPRYLDDDFPGGPIDYRITEPNPYKNQQGFFNFIKSMRQELEEM